jgi:hypothetical protein
MLKRVEFVRLILPDFVTDVVFQILFTTSGGSIKVMRLTTS